MEETIAAICTSLGVGAISIIRVSGPESIEKINKIFNKKLLKAKSHTIHYGHIMEGKEIIDEVLISVMRAPKTYTKEDIVEINCHGGINTTNKVLELVLNQGIRLANPGEFTKRAFLNGRLDLIKADGVMNLIEAKSEIARKMSISQLTGSVTNIINALRDDIVGIISNIEVNIDYPEYNDIEIVTNEKIKVLIEDIKRRLEKSIKESENGKLIKEGIKIGIIGRPNVGKSSLLNLLLEEEKAIVTDIAGTTRDIVEGQIIINGITCNIIDTAGIRQTENIVEKIGVSKSLEIVNSSDLIILLLNNNEELTKEDKELLNMIKNKNHIIVVNKTDLEKKLIINEKTIKISAKENTGIDELKNEIIRIYNLDKIETSDMSYLCNARSISLLKEALNLIKEAISSIDNKEPIDITELSLKEAWNKLGSIIGETYSEELIDEMFERFCLGK